VPEHGVGAIIGKGGGNLRDICARSGAKVQVAKQEDPSTTPGERRIDMSGSAQQVRPIRS
jgi:hypothetical protein